MGVGFLGAGLVTQAIHLPVLAGIADRFHVVNVMDIDVDVAERVAARCGANFTTDADAIMQDPNVDVVVVCSPDAMHAAQVVAACQSGKLAVLCEKPLAVSHAEAVQISEAAATSGTHVMVGAMHVYDPAFRAAHRAWLYQNDEAVFTQSSIFLPVNDFFTPEASEPASPPPLPTSGVGRSDAIMLRGAVLGLAIHNLPLLRLFHTRLGDLVSVHFIRPFGYAIVLGDEVQTLELLGYMGGTWPPNWALRAVGRKCELRVMFPPSFVLAGSSRAELATADSTRVFEFGTNGYQCEWEALYEAAVGNAEPIVSLREVVDDISYALDLADQIERWVGERS
ncbi:MAG: myo-inositol 2-dehydrogenase / D-chiro-inositol 1-dehydrogenase [Ilumatobacteraceae bacterium]